MTQQRARRFGLTIVGGLEAVGAILCLVTLTGFLGRLWWVFELTSHFRFQLAVALGVLTLLWLALRRWRLAAVYAGFAAVNAFLVLSLLWPRATIATTSGPALRLVQLNVHTANQRSDLVLNFLRNAEADVVLLMEVNERWMQDLEPLHTDYPYVLAEPREDNFGIALFSRRPLINDKVIRLGSASVPSLVSELRVGTNSVLLLGTHPLPPGSSEYARLRNEQLKQVATYVRDQTLPVVVFGDLNTTPWSPCFTDLLHDGGLKNSSQGRGLFATWPAWLPALARIPLDQCLVSRTVQVINKRCGPPVRSDHLPVLVEIQVKNSGSD